MWIDRHRPVLGAAVCGIHCLLAIGLTGAVGASQAGGRQWSRYPEIGVPPMNRVVKVDGRVDAGEWSAAVRLPPLLREDQHGFADEETTEICLGYTEEALYMAWRVYRPHGERLAMANLEPGYHQGRAVWSDDRMELFLDPERRGGRSITFVGNAAGAYGDGTVGDGGGTDFEPTWNWVYAARETGFGWEGELSLPFAELGLDTPEPGSVWGMEIWRQNRSPGTYWAQLACSGRRLARFARIEFLGAAPAARVLAAGPLDDATTGVRVALANSCTTARSVRAEYAVYRRRDEVARFNPFREVDSGLDDTSDTQVASFATPQAQLNSVLELFTLVAQEERVLELAPGGRREADLATAATAAGDYLLLYRLVDDAERVLVSAMTPTVRWNPVHVETTPYFLHAEQLDVRVSLHTARLQEAAAGVQASLWQGDRRVLGASATIAAARDGLALSTRDVAPGDYRLQVAVHDAGGGELEREALSLYRPEAPFWAEQEAGLASFVPEPWTPVELTASGGRETVRVWGREYRFDGRFLPAQITAQGEDLFAAAPRLLVRSDGKLLPVRGRMRRTAAEPEYAEWAWQGHAGKLRITATTRVEFDGFMLIDLDVDTAGQDVEQLLVEYPVHNAHATVYQLGHFLNERPGVDVTPYSHGRPRGGRLDQSFHVGFNHGVWLGSERRGFEWSAESAEHWYGADRGRAIEFVRDEEITTLRLRVIDRPAEAHELPALPDQLHYRWGLAVGPVRPYAGAANGIYFTQRNYPSSFPDSATIAELKDRIPGKKAAGVEWVNIFSQWNRDFAFGQPFREAAGIWRRAALAAFFREHGIRPVFYTGWNGLHPNMAMWPYYGEAMRHTPTRLSYGGYKECTYGGYTEYLTGGVKWLYRNLGSRGVYLDGTGAKPCDNPYHGCGFDDPLTGQRVVTRDIFGRRELYKRLYKITHGEVMDEGIIYNHNAMSYLAFESFVSIRHTGEGGGWEFYTNPDQYRAAQNPTQWGIPVEHAWRAFHPVPRNLAWGMALIHDNRLKMYPGHWDPSHPHMHNTYEGGRGIDFRMWVPLQWFAWECAHTWYPYYENAAVLSCSADSVYASFRLNERGQMYFNAVNVAEEPRSVAFAFNRDELGLPARLYARDAVTHQTLEIEDGRFNLDFLGYGPRVLMIAPEPVPRMGPGVE